MMFYTVDIKEEPEFSSHEEFVDMLEGEDRDTFTSEELQKLAEGTGTYYKLLLDQLVADGFSLAQRTTERRVRTFSTSSNDRWYGPGSNPSHGGSGHEQISGFAGVQG